MAGLAGCIASGTDPDAPGDFFSGIDLRGSGHRRSFVGDPVVASICTSAPAHAVDRLVETADFVVTVAGHIIADAVPDWSGIVPAIAEGNVDYFDTLSGRFTIAIIDRVRRKVHLVTDRISQYPCYVLQRGNTWFWSTSQASFARLPDPPGFNERWLHEFVLCNFPATHQSFLNGVSRLSAASVMTIDVDSGGSLSRAYADPLHDLRCGRSQREEAEIAKAVFAERMPAFLGKAERGLSGITQGFDSRVILSHFMDRQDYSTWTYGIPGCPDVVLAKELTANIGVHHVTMELDARFEGELPSLMVRTVWLSSGLQTCIRSSLLYAYSNISANDPCREVLLTGSSGDQLFRSGGGTPWIVSAIINVLFRTGSLPRDLGDTARAMFVSPERCVQHIEAVRDFIVTNFGDPMQTPAHLGYLTYVTPAEYFSGEGALADNFFDYRTPFTDREILKLAWSFNLGTLGNSRFRMQGPPRNRRKNFLHACLISANPVMARQLMQGRPLWAYTVNNAPIYYLVSALYQLRRQLRRRPVFQPLENWPRWFAGPMFARLRALLGPDARIREHIRKEYIDATLASLDPPRMNKLVTAEIVMRLASNGWRLAALEGIDEPRGQ